MRLFEEVKDRFDPTGLMNPGKIVRGTRMDDRTLFRFKPDYRVPEMAVALDWSGYIGAGGGFQGAVEMCNNNGECRKSAAGVMCPSFRVTGNERDVTRGRANALRLAISGQLGPDAFASDDMLETMKLCVSCKGCRRECPTGVDMAKMKIEVLAAANARRGLSLRDRLVAYLPRYAPLRRTPRPADERARRAPRRGVALGTSDGACRPDGRCRGGRHGLSTCATGPLSPLAGRGGEGTALATLEVAMLTLTLPVPEHGERGCARSCCSPIPSTATSSRRTSQAAVAVLGRLGYRVAELRALPGDGARPLCCGRTFLSAGLVEEARTEARRLIAAAAPFLARGVPIVGLEPSCLLTLRDEFHAMLPGAEAERLASRALLFEEFLAGEAAAGRIPSRIAECDGRVLLHGHCHQKAFGAMDAVRGALALVGGLRVETVEFELLRHGWRLRLRGGYVRCVHGDGRALAVAGRPRRGARRHRRRGRFLLPASDRARHRPARATRRLCPARGHVRPGRCRAAAGGRRPGLGCLVAGGAGRLNGGRLGGWQVRVNRRLPGQHDSLLNPSPTRLDRLSIGRND